MTKVVAITGASNGMGFAAAELFAAKGWTVYGGARRVAKIPTGERIHALKLDVTDNSSNRAFIETILAREGRIDVLINNAGYGEYGPVEDISLDKARTQFETNFFGTADLTQLVLPTMRAQKSGRIINISSIGGDIYVPLGAYYHATKAALQQWSDSLDIEIAPFGVRSIIVQPGGTRSSWGEIAMQNARKNLKVGSVYTPLVNQVAALLNADASAIGASSEDLAKVFYAAATDERPKRRYFHAFGDRAVVWLARSYPRVFKKSFMAVMKFLSRRAEKK
ncbi:short-chain dehydrogenase/reductase [Lactococcus hodotermopsidis]|uniref:Short-chain dehydrogenase/reductase n=1 Tax=Pseudolactococcus hodotermopsidis TaxID=2709157 RepID=A0A6A0BFY6_9LACT|nr:SDR family NAD(P)-dependent oxidoreductase [Lactococcus hodotermopsidis]GFH43268.1 short-chain dehydrogenase/reductase [Lactococcus hodotermopsidis]